MTKTIYLLCDCTYAYQSTLVYLLTIILSSRSNLKQSSPYKSCSFIKYQPMCCGKPTIAIISMQKRHDNDKIPPHNHNKYLLLYKETEIPGVVYSNIQKFTIINQLSLFRQ